MTDHWRHKPLISLDYRKKPSLIKRNVLEPGGTVYRFNSISLGINTAYFLFQKQSDWKSCSFKHKRDFKARSDINRPTKSTTSLQTRVYLDTFKNLIYYSLIRIWLSRIRVCLKIYLPGKSKPQIMQKKNWRNLANITSA